MATYSIVCSPVGGFGYANRFSLYVILSSRDGDPATNKSVVDYNVYFQNTTGSGTFTSNTRLYFTLNEQVIKDSTSSVTGPRNGSVLIASGSLVVDHNDDGKKTINYHALVKSSTYGISGELAGQFTLTTIPRASSVNGGTGNIGQTTTISISRATTAFTHTLRYAFGNLSGTIATGVESSYNWTLPETFYTQIPNSKTGTGTIFCDTYNGNELIGTKYTSFTATVTEESSRPVISATLTDVNETTKTLTGDNTKMVRGKSTGQLRILSTVKNSSTIISVKVNGINVGASADITKTYANISSDIFEIVTTDSRGFVNKSYIINPSYVEYIPLTLKALIFRPQPTGSEIQMTYSGNYFNDTFGSVANTLSIKWRYKIKDSEEWISESTVTPVISDNTIALSTISLGTDYNYQTAYEFQVITTDKLTTNVQTIQVSVGMPVFYWGKDFLDIMGELRYQGVSLKRLYANTKQPPDGISFDAINSGEGLHRSGLYSVYSNSVWYNLINVRHRSGDGDGVNYGLQIAKSFDKNAQILFRSQSSGSWSDWEAVDRHKTLYNNASGTRGTVSLSESSANFREIEIFFGDSSNGALRNSIRITSPNGAVVSTSVLSESGTDIRVNTRKITISGSTITNANAQVAYVIAKTTFDVDEQLIYKVVGYR